MERRMGKKIKIIQETVYFVQSFPDGSHRYLSKNVNDKDYYPISEQEIKSI